ncbi:unnamed protein product [Spodoptera exigua]|nr:unnamed protein product [Spodoptera exigua]
MCFVCFQNKNFVANKEACLQKTILISIITFVRHSKLYRHATRRLSRCYWLHPQQCSLTQISDSASRQVVMPSRVSRQIIT